MRKCTILFLCGAVLVFLFPLASFAEWRTYPGETTGPGSSIGMNDWNDAGNVNRVWSDVTVSTNAITLPGDGKYRITSCATSLQTINGTADGDVVVLRIDGSGCTSLTIEDGTGNIDLLGDTSLTLTDIAQFVLLVHNGSVLSNKQPLSKCISLGTLKTTATSYTLGTTSETELYGGTVLVTGAATLTLPAVSTLASCARFAVIVQGAVAVSVDPNAADRLRVDGTAFADGEQATNQSTSGDSLMCRYESSAGWECLSSSPTGTLWTNGG